MLSVVCVCRSKDNLKAQFFPSIMLVQEIKPRFSGLVGSVLAGPPLSSWQVNEVLPPFPKQV